MHARLTLMLIPLIALATVAASPPRDDTQELTTTYRNVEILGSPVVLPVESPPPPVAVVVASPSPPTPIPTDPAIVAVANTPTLIGVITALRQASAEQLIRHLWPDNVENRMIAIARRESGLRCDADNPRSSAAGLFQTIGLHRARAQRLGLSWSDITGPDCVADAFLAYDIWRDSGLAPWRLTA